MHGVFKVRSVVSMASVNNTRISFSNSTPEQIRRARKRQPSVLNGINSSYEDRNSDYLCPICFDVIEEAHMTPCGHTFCYKCITTGLEYSNRCPKCNFVIEKKEQIYPNFLLNELITKYKQKAADKRLKLQGNNPVVSELHELILQESDSMNLNDVYNMLDVLSKKKQQLEADCKAAQAQLLREFLQQVRKHKQEQMHQLTSELSFIDQDLKRVEESSKSPDNCWLVDPASCLAGGDAASTANASTMQDGFNGSKHGSKPQWVQTTLASRRKRVHLHFDDLEDCYLTARTKSLNSTSADGLKEFTENLSKFTRYSSMRPLATLNYATDLLNGTSIVSSIEFDKDNEFFAIAGVTKKIKVFEYGTVIQDIVDIHYPVNEMMCNSKISCISWSSYHKGMLASSDYEGTVTIWDAFTGQKVKMYQEHEKRCWSVDFNKVDTKMIASGSDDAKVKLWSLSCDHSVTSLEAKANVCCVKFNPESRYHLALGSAEEDGCSRLDHCVHYYDLRSVKQPLGVFKGHKKAVSYVKFLNTTELVSASTDSQLKLWNISNPHCLRSFKGHLNEKNFVGLATDGDYVACGSENNALYIYYKGLSKQVLTFRFDVEKDKKEEDSNEFVSAVCWRMGSSVVVAANSQGTIKVLELV
ncbi:E3 ubiquitin-protein ligase COP1-like isoform X4 [Dermacentor andersoni]|uniref:E3 ubiquitin-protein ligase COP1-like isoform X4 n=1 Tax=Dermacentor andersoni TaxID=34620 RepID=UPI002416316D|nr:E3 ubiquitin-protein ligase COP1-like isoform X2 [Dermacentor andersoni]